ncbi:hypothetical protein [Deefgea sp. CFH1-16]|uniref:hypothetical protein n=1 Tax=Deefgea sp. CFH1-16 TaxID=2675457 RepID=UPI0015F6A060|nr:hypothetical protein [Deefgea sp. CFH1-16]MBM5575781.1 hypothetical protein [Deefgea sp. CFH1-16]
MNGLNFAHKVKQAVLNVSSATVLRHKQAITDRGIALNKHSYDSERLLAIAAAKVHQQEADKLHRGITDGVEGLYAQIAKIICAIEKKGDIDTYTAQIISNAKLLSLSTKSHKTTAN